MLVQEIVSRFPEIPDDLKEEPVFVAYVNTFSDTVVSGTETIKLFSGIWCT